MPPKSIGKFITTLITCVFLMACQATSIPPQGATPCWLANLYQGNIKHIYGVAYTYSASKRSPDHIAKANALNNWLISEGAETQVFEQDLSDTTEWQFGAKTLYFIDRFEHQQQVFVLLSEQNQAPTAHNCSIPKCQVAQCEPGFLCDRDEKNVTIFGISAPTAHPNEAMQHILGNAQQLASQLNQAKVMGEVLTLDIDSQYEEAHILQQKFNIKPLDKRLSPVKVRNMCHYNGTLISQIEFDKSGIGQDHPWLEAPNYQNLDGAVGHAKGSVSTGRLSDLVNVAARRGLFELAKVKNIKVESDVELEVHKGGFYSLVRKSHQTTESIVSAFVADMKMELNGKLQPEVYVWLLENKGKL